MGMTLSLLQGRRVVLRELLPKTILSRFELRRKKCIFRLSDHCSWGTPVNSVIMDGNIIICG